MAATNSTSRAHTNRNPKRAVSSPNALIDAIEAQRKALEVALALLTSLDATLQLGDTDAGDVLGGTDPADALVLRARQLARPVEVLRIAIQRIYQAYSRLDWCHLSQPAARCREIRETELAYAECRTNAAGSLCRDLFPMVRAREIATTCASFSLGKAIGLPYHPRLCWKPL